MRLRPKKFRPAAVGAATVWLLAFVVRSALADNMQAPTLPPPTGEAPEASTASGLQPRITTLIERLGHDNYFVRQQAEKELTALGFDAFDALSAAVDHEDLEIAARARSLLNRLGQVWASDEDPPEVRAFLDDYQWQDRSTRRQRLRSLAYLPDGAGIAALGRLVRFERSAVLSKYAALALIERFPAGEPWDEDLADAVEQQLRDSRRAAVGWVRTWLAFRRDPQEVLPRWTALIDTEETRLRQPSSATSAELVSQLIRRRIEWLNRRHAQAELALAMDRLVALAAGDAEALRSLVDWLLRRKAWAALERLGSQAGKQFAGNPLLLYALAQAQAELGHPQRAAQTSEVARKSLDGGPVHALALHLALAEQLRTHGLHGWAEKEYRYVLDLAGTGNNMKEYAIAARSGLAEMLHDLGRDDQAATAMEGLLADLQEHQTNPFGSGILSTMQARLHYFRARHLQQQGEHDQYRDALRRAIQSDASDIDVLIACYRLPGEDAAYRQKIRALIKHAAEVLHQQIEQNPDDPTACNQFAWLIGNTEGDFDAALRHSKRSLQIEPLSGGYYDTLAHVYFGKKDYERAFRAQLLAVQLEPHSGLLNKKLKVFHEAWEEEAISSDEQNR